MNYPVALPSPVCGVHSDLPLAFLHPAKDWWNRPTSREFFHKFPASLSGKVRVSLGNSFIFIVFPADSWLAGTWLATNMWKQEVCPRVPQSLLLNEHPHCAGEPSGECELELRTGGLCKAASFPARSQRLHQRGGPQQHVPSPHN